MRLVAFAIGLALMVAIVPGWAGLATTPRWDVGVLIAFAFFCAGGWNGRAGRNSLSTSAGGLPHGDPDGSRGRRGTRAAAACGIGLVIWLALSLVWSNAPLDGIDQAAKLIVVATAFAFGATLTDLRPLIAGAAIGIAISSLVALAQWFGWTGIETSSTGTPAGLFFNHNRLAEAAALVLAASIAARLWWALLGLVPALILPQDRTAWLAVAVVLGIIVWRRLREFERFVLAAIAVFLVALVAMLATAWRTERFGPAGITERLAMWSFVADHFTLLGHGLGSFTQDGPTLAAPLPDNSVLSITKAEHPHNEYLWLAYEGGLPALGLFGAFAVWCWRSCADQGRLVLVAFAVVACFAMPLHDPATALLAAMCAGFSVGDRDRVRAAADAGGSALRAWVEQERERLNEPERVADGRRPVPIRAAIS